MLPHTTKPSHSVSGGQVPRAVDIPSFMQWLNRTRSHRAGGYSEVVVKDIRQTYTACSKWLFNGC